VRILLVGHHPPTNDAFARVLGREGHVVVAEGDGVAAVKRESAEPFDMLICDIGLPGIGGFGVAHALRAAGSTVPLIAVTDDASDDERTRALAAGFNGYIATPISGPALLREIATADSQRAGRSVLAPGIAASAPVARPRGVLGGLVVVAMGLPFVLQPLGVPNAASYLFLAMGMAFLISFVRGRQYVYLIPMVTLSSFGIALLLPTWIPMRPEAVAPSFVAIVALGFLAAFVLVPTRRWPLIPAALLGGVAAARLITGSSPLPAPLEPFLVPIVLVGVGLYLLVEKQ
jgi:CheY-like chemotaxis protein